MIVSRDLILEMVESNPNLTNSEISKELGISRQRVSQICAKAGITLAHAYGDIEHGLKKSDPKPRLITGGADVALGNIAIGAVSEALVVADLIARGYKTYTPTYPHRSHDIIAVDDNHAALTFEVRSGRRSKNGNILWRSNGRLRRSDYYAIVLTGEPVIYKPDLPPSAS